MSINEAASCNGTNDISITDIADLLAQQFIIITGGKSKEGYSLITFPDNGLFHTLSNNAYIKLLSYITTVPASHDTDNGFALIVDRRNDKWSSVRHILFKFTEFFPGLIHVVYVLRPVGFFQKAISEVSNKFFKEDFRFKVIICNELHELYQFVEKSQLTTDLRGELLFCNQDWIQQRISLEHFSTQTKAVSRSLENLATNVQKSAAELPITVEDTIYLLNEHTIQYGLLKESILELTKRGDILLNDIRSGSSHIPSIINITAIERSLMDLEATEAKFDRFWENHIARLRQCLDLRTFEQDFRIIQVKLDDYLKFALDMNEVGESVEHVDRLINDLNDFHCSCQLEIDRSDELMKRGKELSLTSQKYVSLESVEPKCDELRRINQSLAEKLLRRVESLKKSRELQVRIEKANKWCAQGVELLGSQNIEKCSMFPEHVEQILIELEQFVASADEFDVSGSEDLYVMFQDSITPETKPLVTQVLQRIEDVRVMCDKRITNLRRLIAKPNRPIQPVNPEPAIPISQLNCNGDVLEGDETLPLNEELNNGYITNDTVQTRRDHILRELLETEKIYASDIKLIITGYKDMMRDEEMRKLVPADLISKEDVLFCNLDDLYSFHSGIFLPIMQTCIFDVGKIASLFLDHKDRLLELYSFYCQNLPKSEKLREKVGEKNPFFVACQMKLEHKLPLAADMLKPVQRITKYQLLLKDLIKNTDDERCVAKLNNALDCMLVMLKCVNDRMHQIQIIGIKCDLLDQGDLLLQGTFSVWAENKKDILKELRLKPMRRHVLLYRKAIIFCKKRSSENKGKYQFKGMFKMSKIGLTETVRGDAKKFEVWLEGRQEVYTIQASTIEQKEIWVKEIKQVLFEQLAELKGEKIRQYAEKYACYTKAISLDGMLPSPCSSRSNSRPNSVHEITDGSSSEVSNSDDEDMYASQVITNGRYVALADYCATSQNEVSMKEGEPLELLKIGGTGWWYIKLLTSGAEGWVPASYLELKEYRKGSSRSSASVSSQQSVNSQQSVVVE